MSKIKSFDKTNLAVLRSELTTALSIIGKTHGITISVGNISYRDDSFTTKLTAVCGSPSAKPDESQGKATWRRDFLSYAGLYGIDRAALDSTILWNGQNCVIVGARPRAKLSLVLRKPDNAFIQVSQEAVKLILDAKKPAVTKPAGKKPRK